MNRVAVIFNKYGNLIGVCEIGNRKQTELAIESVLEEWFDHGNGSVVINDSDWNFLENNQSLCVSIPFTTNSNDEIEIYTRTLYTPNHYQVGE